MGKGLGGLQKKALAVLKTKAEPNSQRCFFSTDEVISEISFNYRLWVAGLPPYESFFADKPRSAKRLRSFEPLRVSVHRALQALEKRGLVVSYFARHSRWWAVPERVRDLDHLITREVQLKWIEYDGEVKKYRRERWRDGWRVRQLKRMVPELWLKFRFGLATEEEQKKIKSLYESLQKGECIKTKLESEIIQFKLAENAKT